jgi:hypothetical protein
MDKQATRKATTSPTAASRWPDLLKNYRKLAIPAVAAAVLPERGALRRGSEPAGERAEAGGRKQRP